MRHQPLDTEEKTLLSHRNEEHTTGVGPAASRCLSEDEVMRLCAGELAEEHLPRIDEHLDRCEACQRWVAEVMAHGETAPADDDTSLHPGAFRAGAIAAGRFRIVRFIKRGGMGEVYEAIDSVLEIRVALKTILSTACDNPRAVRKLKAEVQLARSIRHPNVCSVFDIWEHRSGPDESSSVFFFTMEFIDGLTLRQLLERSGFELEETLRIAQLALFGLRAAHDSGVVHRDFKSDNVMLRGGRNDDSRVVVMDFGLARTLENEGGASNDSEQFAGSVAYMAPEQVEGRRHIGPEADVFAFGVVLFEMLTRELPWVGDSPWTTAALRLTQRAPAPSRLRPGLSPRLDAFVLECLSREPADRYKDAREALAAFEELSLPPPRRPRRGVALGAAALLGLVAALGLQQRTSSRVEALQPSAPEGEAPAPPAPIPPTRSSEPTVTASAPATAEAVRGAEEPPPLPFAPPSDAEVLEGIASAAPEPSPPAIERAASHPRRRSPRADVVLQKPSDQPAAKPSLILDEPTHGASARVISEPAAAIEPAATDSAARAPNAPTERAPGAPVQLRDFE